jgi:hypothetical protein
MRSAGLFLLMIHKHLILFLTELLPSRTKITFFYWQTLSLRIVLSSRLP